MHLVINGQPRDFPELPAACFVADLIQTLQLKGDRVAVERNGDIVHRPEWSTTPVVEGDRFEIVHFVGGGSPARSGSSS